MSEELLSRCRWPALGDPYEAALREAVRRLGERTHPTAIVAAGSIVRGEGDARSDIDLYVLHGAGWKARFQWLIEGVPFEVFVNTPSSVRGYLAEEQGDGRPITAHMLATGWVVLEEGEGLAELVAEARALLAQGPSVSAESLLYMRYSAADMVDNARDTLERDPTTASLILTAAVAAMLPCDFLARGEFVPGAKRIVPALRERRPELALLVERFAETADAAERLRLADAIASKTIGATGFFEWESSRIPVE